MPITMHWVDESKQVFIFDLHTGDWTWREYDLAVDEALELFSNIDHDFAAVVLSASAMPEGNAMIHLARAGRLQPSHLKLYIIVGGNSLIRTFNNIFSRMYP